ncbi:hypothetical protein Tco_0022688 [Tanacetum coccineum]
MGQRKSLSLEPDKNKQWDQAICLMYMKRISREMYGSYAKSYECTVMGMHGLDSCKNHVMNFSLFLSRKPSENIDREVKSPSGKEPEPLMTEA